jgi:hypothetical protein
MLVFWFWRCCAFATGVNIYNPDLRRIERCPVVIRQAWNIDRVPDSLAFSLIRCLCSLFLMGLRNSRILAPDTRDTGTSMMQPYSQFLSKYVGVGK